MKHTWIAFTLKEGEEIGVMVAEEKAIEIVKELQNIEFPFEMSIKVLNIPCDGIGFSKALDVALHVCRMLGIRY